MPTSSFSAKPLPNLPAKTTLVQSHQHNVVKDSSTPWLLDDEAKIHLWKLIHTWLRHEQLQVKWATVINDILMRVLQTTSTKGQPLEIYLQIFETGSASHSKYLPSISHGTPLQSLTELPIPGVYGGTIRLYGVQVALQNKLVDILAVSIYTLYSLQLEAVLMKDHHMTFSTALHQQHTRKQHATMNSETENPPWKYGLLGWILGKRNDKRTTKDMDQLVETSTSIDLSPSLLKTNSIPKRRLSMHPLKSFSRKQIDNNTFKQSSSSNIVDSHHYKNIRLSLEHAMISTSPSCRFDVPSIINILEKEEENVDTMKTITIVGQQQQYHHYQQEINRQKQRSSDQPLRNKLTSLARRSSSFLSLGLATEQLKGSIPNITITLPQSITAYSMLRIPIQVLDDTSKMGLDLLCLDTTTIEAFIQHQNLVIYYTSHPIGCPERPCLGPTLCTIQYFRYNDSLPYSDQTLGMILEKWLEQRDSPCKSRIEQQNITCNGYTKNGHGSSHSLENQQQRSIVEQQDQKPVKSDIASTDGTVPTSSSSSSSHAQHQRRQINTKMTIQGCNQPLKDHTLCFSNGSHRINVYFVTSTSTNLSSATTTTTNEDGSSLACWLYCTICDVRTPLKRLSAGTHQFSFGKYLELCLYSTRFTGSRQDLCEHVLTNPTSVARCFGRVTENRQQGMDHHITITTEIRFIKEDINVYTLRGSPLQIAPRTTSTSATAIVIDFYPRISRLTMEKWKMKEGRLVDDLFRKIRQHLSYLQDHLLNGKSDSEISSWRATLDSDHEQLTSILKNCSSQGNDGNLNDFRRFFTLKASMIIDNLNEWQLRRWLKSPQQYPEEKHQQQLNIAFTWNERPDYMNSDMNQTIHCFPDSAIMVRELEPTSIIAYTLSSNEYVEELIYERTLMTNDLDDNPVTTISTKTAPVSFEKPAAAPPPATLSTKTSSDGSNGSDATQVVDGYYSSVERKYIAPATGAATETASFRTMVMETVKGNVSDMEQHSKRLSQMKQRWRQPAVPPLSPPLSPSLGKVRIEHSTEHDFDLTPYQATKDIKESTFYQGPPLSTTSGNEDGSASSITTNPGPTLTSSMEDPSKIISPHIKHRFVHGKMEFTCIVYYASEFETLRRSCDVDQLMIESLGRCQNWSTTGGKSKSRFYKTQDDRFVIKEMVNSWNIAEKDAFLRFAPKYFDYIKETIDTPSILAKIFGFYTVQMRTMDDKKQVLNIDVIVMEQLFYGQSISKIFDFKGIPDRQVDEERRSQPDVTLWDGDWREGYRMGYVTHEQSREWVQTAIERDTQFLSNGNIMDYSLLVGVDKIKKELTVGIVDFIGAYTWYKKIESKSKSTIHRNREVTVLPPDQYRLRFCREVFDYFIPVAGKFDKIRCEQTSSSAWMK